MTDKKFTDLPAATVPLTGAEIVALVQGGVSSQSTAAAIAALSDTKGADLASAATVAIGASAGEFIHITGITTITAFDTVAAGTRRALMFTGILVLTYNATSLILPTAANITTAVGDCCIMISEGLGNWRCIDYARASGAALVGSGGTVPTGTGFTHITAGAQDAAAVTLGTNLSIAAGALNATLSVPVQAAQTASYTAVLADAGTMTPMNVASANTFTVPPNSSIAFPVGTELHVYNMGAGICTLTAGVGVTINKLATLALKAQYATATLKQTAANVWVAFGALT